MILEWIKKKEVLIIDILNEDDGFLCVFISEGRIDLNVFMKVNFIFCYR